MDHKHDHSHRQHDHGTHGGAPAQADPGKAIDPVCGMQVTIKAGPSSLVLGPDGVSITGPMVT